ncbi:MAG TPA: NADH-quinone oxidoreductase subunit NuoE [Desulfobacteraceae bacterium]|jgi:NADH:ubiquinone oxidoreductase subunit E|nr:NADH-quinone oxidoreductase subunit NuoE [Desulfobacteraceae bacterium]HPJ67322.1 NADH-quinone oxidoreductase subunit NuoE [Desulfobacteraceae bacterium]HPQ28197.1 NADH-quinone oxidoreductase subunit NuoE [Desulfobacteraceae bacterium]
MVGDANRDDEDRKLNELKEFIENVQKKEYPNSYLIAVLHKAQNIYNYLRKDIIHEIAIKMNIPVSTIWGVATFYHYFNLEPRGKYVIFVCLGTACYVKGAERILNTLREQLKIDIGQTTDDMLFTLLETRCLGACGISPVMMVNNKVHSQLTPKKVVEIINNYRKEQ